VSIEQSIFDDLFKKKIIPDGSQKKLINIFDHFYSKEKKFFSKFFKKPNFLYIYGDVGRGKTFLMDIFYEHYLGKKNRIHYHNFMKKIHDDLKVNQGIKDPIAHFCKTLKNQIDILFLDEFNITFSLSMNKKQKILINLDKSYEIINNNLILNKITTSVGDIIYIDNFLRKPEIFVNFLNNKKNLNHFSKNITGYPGIKSKLNDNLSKEFDKFIKKNYKKKIKRK